MYAHVRTRNDVLKPHIRTQYMVVPDNKQFRCVRFYVQKVCSCAFFLISQQLSQETWQHLVFCKVTTFFRHNKGF